MHKVVHIFVPSLLMMRATIIDELIDERRSGRLNGRRDAHRTLRFRDHHHSVEHVALPRARSAAHRAAFLLPETKVKP